METVLPTILLDCYIGFEVNVKMKSRIQKVIGCNSGNKCLKYVEDGLA